MQNLYIESDTAELEIVDWNVDELAEEAQNPTPYPEKEEYLRAIAHHPMGTEERVEIALAQNGDLPTDVRDEILTRTGSIKVIDTLLESGSLSPDERVYAHSKVSAIM